MRGPGDHAERRADVANTTAAAPRCRSAARPARARTRGTAPAAAPRPGARAGTARGRRRSARKSPPLAPMITRPGPGSSSTAARLATAPPSRNSSSTRHEPIAFSAGRPKISRNTRLPSRCAQPACRNRAVNRRSTACRSRRVPGAAVERAPGLEQDLLRRRGPRALYQKNASHSSPNSSGQAQRRLGRWRRGG